MNDQIRFILNNTYNQNSNGPQAGGPLQYTIPVVVHVIHLGEAVGTGTNISDAQIQGAINGLNDRFANIIGAGLDIQIDFCLAVRDPNGCPTNGIVRVNGSSIPNYQSGGITRGAPDSACLSVAAHDTTIKNLSHWPADRYYNIWVVCNICGGWGGYAYYPNGSVYDGTVIKYQWMANNNATLAHEVGHGFNLPHTFNGDGGNAYCPVDTNCSIDGDYICDTPPHKQGDCGGTNPCSGAGIWNNSRYNYMSYCSPSQTNARFTQNQKDRMRATLLVAPRASLLNSLGCVPSDFGTVVTKTNVSCNGICDGSISINPTCPYTYSYNWPNGAASQNLTNLCAGTYTVTITASNNQSTVIPITITQPDVILDNATTSNIPCFGGSSGSITVLPSGGTPFNCNGNFTINIGTGTVTQSNTAYPNPLGNYYNSARHQILYRSSELNALGFTAGRIYSIALNVASVSGTSTYNNFQIQIGQTSQTTLTSFISNLSDYYGPSTLTINSGWNTFNLSSPFLWDGVSNIVIQYCFTNTNATLNSPVYGSYTSFSSIAYLYQNTSNLCTSTNGYLPYSWSFRPNTRLVVCNDTSYYQYTWSNGSHSTSINNLSAGIYLLSITDANGCVNANLITVAQPAILNAAVDFVTNPACNGYANGNAFVSVSGGTSPYFYAWSNNQTSSLATGLGVGNFAVTVTDAHNCIDTAYVTISQPDTLFANAFSQNVLCNSDSSGSATVLVSGGTQPYSYLWSDGQSSAAALSLQAGNYAVTANDFNNCTVSTSIFIGEPDPLSITSIKQNACYICDGYLSIIPIGGTPPYTYNWSSGEQANFIISKCAGNYYFTVTDNNNCIIADSVLILQLSPPVINASSSVDSMCNGNSAILNAIGTAFFHWSPITGLDSPDSSETWASPSSSTYYMAVGMDSLGCTDTAILYLEVTQIPLPTIAPHGSTVFCEGENVTLESSTAHFYNWNNGANTQSVLIDTTGNYFVTISDSNGCIAASLPLVVTVYPTPIVSITGFNAIDETTPAFTLSEGSPIGGIYTGVGISNGIFDPIAAGIGNHLITYTYTDANGCTDSASTTIIVEASTSIFENPNHLLIDISPNPNNGAFSVTIFSMMIDQIELTCFNVLGEKVYEKNWNGISGNLKSDIDLTSFASGIYLIRIVANFKSATQKISICK